MVKNILIFIISTLLLVLCIEHLLENSISKSEEAKSLQIQFKSDLTQGMAQLSAIGECYSYTNDIATSTKCALEKGNESRKYVEKYTYNEGCIGEMANELVHISQLFDEVSNIYIEISSGKNKDIERGKEEAAKALNLATERIETFSKLNNEDACLLDKIK